MALLNTAYILASWGRHVLIVDMDLEAPGIGGFLTRLGELSPMPSKDLIDLLALALQPDSTELPPVSEFICSVLPEKLESLAPELGEIGRLDVMAPDTGRDYTQRLDALALQELPRERIIELGQKLHRYCKRQRFSRRPLGIEEFEDPIETPYDYILVDSRTGFTEIGGLCIGPLSDRLVVLTGLNDQNINGTKHFLEEVGILPEPRQDTEPWDDADPVGKDDTPLGLGPKPTIVVATPVPIGEIDFKRQRMLVLEKAIGVKPLRVSYHPRLALMETIFVRDFDDEPPAADYHRLATRITGQVHDSPDQLASMIANTADQAPLDGEKAIRVLAQRPDLAPVILHHAFREKTPSNWKRRVTAILARNHANRSRMLANWAAACMEESRTGLRALSEQFLLAAASKSAESARLNPAHSVAFNNWGNALLELAKTKSGNTATRLLDQAREKLRAGGAKGLYNLACLEAFQGNAAAAVDHLRTARSTAESPRLSQIETDPDFDPIRADPGFMALVSELRAAQRPAPH